MEDYERSGPEERPTPRRNGAVPIAIIIAALILGGAVYFTQRDTTPDKTVAANDVPTKRSKENIRPVDESDWIRGNPNAPIILVEYSDLECPFCKQYHTTLKRIIAEYGTSGQVAWVFRHFPIVELHQKATTEALASECVGSLGGQEAFWQFVDRVYETTKGNDSLDLTLLVDFAEEAGVSPGEFEGCMQNGKLMENVEADFNNALSIGGEGTPHTIVIARGKSYVIPGAQPYPAVKTIVDTLIRQLSIGELTPPSRATTATTLPPLPTTPTVGTTTPAAP